jgi:glycosyltransferase involved in cell wall biosynthesis
LISGKKVVAVIPAYNEEKSIARVILGTERVVDKVIVVDDGSRDYTSPIARRLGVAVLVHDRNEGKGAALRTGIEYAKNQIGFDILVTLDADLQHDPGDIPKVLEPIVQGNADVVVGVRPMDPSVMPRNRIAGNKLFDAMSNKSKEKIRDTQSGFRAYSSDSLSKIRFVENGLAIESQTFIDAVNAGLRIKEVSISTTYEGIAQKRSALSHFNHVLDYIITRTVADSPLLYLGLPGIAAIIVGIVAGLRVVQIFITNHQQIAAGTALISVALIIVGAVLVATSLIMKLLKIQTTMR